jgi:hypothetical protein
MSVTLTTPIARGSNNAWRIAYVGTNWEAQEVIIRVLFDSGDVRDYRFSKDGGFATIAALTAAVANFRGLRNDLETYLAGADPTLAGTVT